MPLEAARTSTGKQVSKDKKELSEICIGAVLFILGIIMHHNHANKFVSLAVFVVGYLILGGKILLEAGRNILRGQIFDENSLMSIATLGAFAIQEYPVCE